uniref:Peptidase S1 domain-containing protein n=1 Tax=Megaselia scalaris TaxID=36166 RepID=T1GX02_MEGSC
MLLKFVIFFVVSTTFVECYSIGHVKNSNTVEYPYQVMLIGRSMWSNRILCGGTLLTTSGY